MRVDEARQEYIDKLNKYMKKQKTFVTEESLMRQDWNSVATTESL